MARTWRYLLLPLALVALVLVACVPAATPTAAPAPTPTAAAAATPTTPPVVAPKYGGTLRWTPQASLKAIDPFWTTAAVTWNLSRHIWDVLFGWDGKLAPKPQMVESWQVSEDVTKYTFVLRSGLTYHDGTPVKAEDVPPSIKRWAVKLSQGVSLMKLVKSIDVVDDRTFTITTTQPFGLVVDYLMNQPFVMPKALASVSADEAIKSYIGSGPFKFVSWEPGNRVVLERFAAYKPRTEPQDHAAGAKTAYLDRIEQVEVPDPATRVAGLETGQFDYSEGIPGDFYPRLKDHPKVKLEVVRPWAHLDLVFNKILPPFNNVKARRAVAAVVDKEEYMRAAYGPQELWELCPAAFHCGSRWASEAGKEVYWAKPDVAKGKALWAEALKETGYTGPIRIIAATDYPDFWAASLLTKANLEKLGATVDLAASDWATVVTRRTFKKPLEEGGWNIFHTWWSFSGSFDPFQAGWLPSTWFGWYDSPRMQEAQLKFATAKTEAEKKEWVDKAQLIYYDEYPIVIMGELSFLMARQHYVKGYVPDPLGPMLWGVWLDK